MRFPDAIAARLGRPDLMPYYGAPTNGLIAQDDAQMGVFTGGDSLTVGRIGLSLVILYVGALATFYVATRARQF